MTKVRSPIHKKAGLGAMTLPSQIRPRKKSFYGFQGLQEAVHLHRGRRRSQLQQRDFNPWSKDEPLQGVRVVLIDYIRITSKNLQINRKGSGLPIARHDNLGIRSGFGRRRHIAGHHSGRLPHLLQ
jgi:hypothetical protein